MKNFSFRNFARQPVLAAAAAISLLLVDQASATSGQNVGAVASNLINQLGSVGKVALGGAFLFGIVMIAAGLMKLKQASDSNGQQVKYADGIWRLAAGTGLVAIPSVAGVLGSTFSLTPGSISSATGGASF